MQENNTPQQLIDLANLVLASAPCSLEMPAGTGKTHLIAAAVLEASKRGDRCLILTHTNAGVDALRKRLKKFGVPSSVYRVDTITGFAFSLARAYRTIGGVEVPDVPDWMQSESYIAGAQRVAQSTAVKMVLKHSFDYAFIDEYQDCNTDHHSLILAITESVPKTVVLGDRLQGIFGFRGQRLVDWETDVFPNFPLLEVAHTPHRWRDTNPDLGSWLHSIRGSMYDGSTLDLGDIEATGVHWVRPEDRSIADVAFSFNDFDETVVLIDKWPRTVARHASSLGGHYAVMEDVRGNFMVEQLEALPDSDSYKLAPWLARLAKESIVGLSGLDAPLLSRLDRNESVTHYSRADIQDVVIRLDELRRSPSYAKLVETADHISSLGSLKIYRWEAWRDTVTAIRNSDVSGEPPLKELAIIRDRIRHTGRRSHARVASRTVLIKGLEYDHVIIADVNALQDPKNLYVALTRARKSIHIISSNRRITLINE